MYVINKDKTRADSEQRTRATDYRRQADKALLARDHSPVKTAIIAKSGMSYEEAMTLLEEEESAWFTRK